MAQLHCAIVVGMATLLISSDNKKPVIQKANGKYSCHISQFELNSSRVGLF